MTEDDLPLYPWNDLIDMSAMGDGSRATVVALNAIHDAITANSKLLIELIATIEGLDL